MSNPHERDISDFRAQATELNDKADFQLTLGTIITIVSPSLASLDRIAAAVAGIAGLSEVVMGAINHLRARRITTTIANLPNGDQ